MGVHVRPEELELIGCFEHGHRPRGDQVACRFAASVLQQQEEEVNLELRERLAVDLCLQQHGDQVIGRLLTTQLAHGIGVGVHLHRRQHLGIVGQLRVEAERRLGQLEDAMAILGRHADEVGDDLQRQLDRDVAHQVALAARADLVEESIDRGLHARFELAHSAGRESSVDQLSFLGVLGLIQTDEQPRGLIALVAAPGEER